MSGYRPNRPYEFQSGQNEGKTVEQLMFNDYSKIHYMLTQSNKRSSANKNILHKHLLWIFAQAKTRKPTETCRMCGKNTVKYFSVVPGRLYASFSSAFMCCGDKKCMRELSGEAHGHSVSFMRIEFDSILHFSKKGDQKRVADLLKQAYGLPKRLTRGRLFNFFSE
ncbi:MAG: hypothetical protein ABFQ53_01845 [Patescibacteria group bacterium]